VENRCIDRIAVGDRHLEIVRIPAQRAGLPALIFLHEGLGSARLWREFPAALAQATGCEAIAYSRAGNGFSTVLSQPRTREYMHDEALSVLPALLRALGIEETILIGHSDGASIALVYAAQHPDGVRGLVLEAPHLFVEDLSLRSIARIRAQYETSDLPQRMSRHHADARATFYGWNDVWLSPQFADWNIEAYAGRVIAPALAVQGLDDEYGTIAQIDALADGAAGPVDRLLLARCGHSPHRDRAALVQAAVSAWISERCG
jgi:pimeloyl-ACP methyl ester carboxylesterase